MAAKRHANAIHPPARFNQQITQDILSELITVPLTFDAKLYSTPHRSNSMFNASKLRDELYFLSANEANRLHTLSSYLFDYYKRYLTKLIIPTHVGIIGIGEEGIYTLRHIVDRLAFQIFTQEKQPTQYQSTSILDGFISVAMLNQQALEQLIPKLPPNIQTYFSQLFQEGYIANYYEIINPENIYVRAMRGELPLTPANFEQAATSKLEDYSETIQRLLLARKQRERKRIIRNPVYYKEPFEIKGESSNEVNWLFLGRRTRYSDETTLGETRYGWSRNKLLEALHKFSQPEGPIEFLYNALVFNPMESYRNYREQQIRRYYIPYYMMDLYGEKPTQNVINRILFLKSYIDGFWNFIDQLGVDLDLWKISYTGLFNYHQERLEEIARTDPQSPFLNITLSDLHFYTENAWKLMPLPGLQGSPYRKGINNKKMYYEYLYRHLNLTTTYFNWKVICQRNLLDEGLMRNLAIYDHQIREVLPLKSVCTILGVRRPTELESQVRSEISEIADPLKMQPGSLLVQRERLGPRFTGTAERGFAESLGAENLEPAYRGIYQRCSNLDQYSTDDLLELAHDLGLYKFMQTDLKNKSKEEICGILTRYINQYRSAKQLF